MFVCVCAPPTHTHSQNDFPAGLLELANEPTFDLDRPNLSPLFKRASTIPLDHRCSRSRRGQPVHPSNEALARLRGPRSSAPPCFSQCATKRTLRKKKKPLKPSLCSGLPSVNVTALFVSVPAGSLWWGSVSSASAF